MSGLPALPCARLRGEPLSEAHWDDLRVMQQDERMMRYIGGVRPEEGTRAYIQRHRAHWDAHGVGFWLLFAPDSTEAVGLGGLRLMELDGAAELEFGYGFLPHAWGRGFGRETVRGCLAYGGHHLQRTTMIALVDPDNAASRDLLLREGLVFERRLTRDGVTSDLFRADARLIAAQVAAHFSSGDHP